MNNTIKMKVLKVTNFTAGKPKDKDVKTTREYANVQLVNPILKQTMTSLWYPS